MLRLNYSHDSNQCTTFTLPERILTFLVSQLTIPRTMSKGGGLCTCLKEHIMSINLRLKFTGVHFFGLPMKSFISVFFFPFISFIILEWVLSFYIYNTSLFTALDMYWVKWTSFWRQHNALSMLNINAH